MNINSFWSGMLLAPFAYGAVLSICYFAIKWWRNSRRWFINLPFTQHFYAILVWWAIGRLNKRYSDFRWWNDRWYVTLQIPAFKSNPPKEVVNENNENDLNYPANDE